MPRVVSRLDAWFYVHRPGDSVSRFCAAPTLRLWYTFSTVETHRFRLPYVVDGSALIVASKHRSPRTASEAEWPASYKKGWADWFSAETRTVGFYGFWNQDSAPPYQVTLPEYQITIEVDGKRRRVSTRAAKGEERERLLALLTAAYPPYAVCEQRNKKHKKELVVGILEPHTYPPMTITIDGLPATEKDVPRLLRWIHFRRLKPHVKQVRWSVQLRLTNERFRDGG